MAKIKNFVEESPVIVHLNIDFERNECYVKVPLWLKLLGYAEMRSLFMSRS